MTQMNMIEAIRSASCSSVPTTRVTVSSPSPIRRRSIAMLVITDVSGWLSSWAAAPATSIIADCFSLSISRSWASASRRAIERWAVTSRIVSRIIPS